MGGRLIKRNQRRKKEVVGMVWPFLIKRVLI
jgi:hypothetical protein